jgi:hypothetical protein
MLAKQYTHRLPADQDMGRIHERAARLGPLWDATEHLIFKAFVTRERGRLGAPGHAYGSIYLWQDAAAAADFVFGERFRNVIDSFGRPQIETWLPFDARRGRALDARSLYREDILLDDTTDLAALRRAEIERNADDAAQADTLAVVSAVDPSSWRLVRLTLSADVPGTARPGIAYRILYLARPGLGAVR